jgi:hypothetical protein
VSRLAIEVERINVFWPKPDLSHLIKPGFDLAFEFWFFASWARLVKRPSGRHILADAESICFFFCFFGLFRDKIDYFLESDVLYEIIIIVI